jgi:large subunit ribosomal protein L32
MAVPKFKTSKSKKRKRRTHDKLVAAHLVPCGNCGLSIPMHRICPNCGHYRVRGKGGTRTRQVIAQDEG